MEKEKICTKNGIIKFLLVVLSIFIIQTILCITQGYMRVDEYLEYAKTVENANITTVLGPLMFTGPFYSFILAIAVAIFSKVFIKRDKQLKKILYFLPIYVILIFIPSWLCAAKFYHFFMM